MSVQEIEGLIDKVGKVKGKVPERGNSEHVRISTFVASPSQGWMEPGQRRVDWLCVPVGYGLISSVW